MSNYLDFLQENEMIDIKLNLKRLLNRILKTQSQARGSAESTKLQSSSVQKYSDNSSENCI